MRNLEDRLQRGRSGLEEVRQSGLPTASAAMGLLTGSEQTEMLAGTPGAMARLRERARREVALERARSPEQADAAYRLLLEQQQAQLAGRTGAERTAMMLPFMAQRRQFFWDRGLDPNLVPTEQLNPHDAGGNITDAAIRRAGTVFRNRLALAQGRLAFGEAGVRTGITPNMREGALNLENLPNLFRGGGSDALNVHREIQIEATRDQREQARFDAQMRMWQDILEALRNPGAGQNPWWNPAGIGLG
jgi:hypothetical protein